MKNKNQKILLTATVLFLIFVLPILIYLARTKQLFRSGATFGQVTINLVPLDVSKNIGEPFLVDVFENSADKQLSGITVALNANLGGVIIQSVSLPTDANTPFTDLIYDKTIDPYSFTVLSKKPNTNLPTGSFKVATISVVSFESGTNTLGIDAANSAAVGFNGTSDDVAFSVVTGTQVSYTMAGSLCKIPQCVATANITLTPNLRPDNKYNVNLNFPMGDAQTKLYKVYKNIGAAVPDAHSDSNLAGIASPSASLTQQQFIDTNKGVGYPGETNLHYDIDSYYFCAEPSATLTLTLTPTATPTPTPSG